MATVDFDLSGCADAFSGAIHEAGCSLLLGPDTSAQTILELRKYIASAESVHVFVNGTKQPRSLSLQVAIDEARAYLDDLEQALANPESLADGIRGGACCRSARDLAERLVDALHKIQSARLAEEALNHFASLLEAHGTPGPSGRRCSHLRVVRSEGAA